MRLVLDPSENAAHGDWLREKPGAYEWWYFDALADDGEWALTCIWFLGNPFSPYYRLSALGRPADPFSHNALLFALYRHGRLYAYHFTRFSRDFVCADESRPAMLRFGPNTLSSATGRFRLQLADENANRRSLTADITFAAPFPSALPSPVLGDGGSQAEHFWLPAAPACRVRGRIELREAHNPGEEVISFNGDGYHDHNWGTLPFASNIRDWYWARAGFGDGRAIILYHVVSRHTRRPVSHLLQFRDGRLVRHDEQAQVTVSRARINAFGLAYATHLQACSGELTADFRLERRLDSAPFYVRCLCGATILEAGEVTNGAGVGEYFRPRMLSWPLVASAMKARIVER